VESTETLDSAIDGLLGGIEPRKKNAAAEDRVGLRDSAGDVDAFFDLSTCDAASSSAQ
jgi:hypothetical protein